MYNKEELLDKILSFRKTEYYKEMKVWNSLYKGENQTVNVSKLVSQELTSLIMNEEVRITITDDEANERLNNIIEVKYLNKFLSDFIENVYGLGGGIIENVIINNEVKFNYIHPTQIIPLRWNSNKKIQDVMFVLDNFNYSNNSYYVVRVHERINNNYIIRNLLLKEKEDTIGSIDSIESIKDIKEYKDLEEVIIIKDFKGSLFHYLKPNINNNIEPDSPLGIPLIANSLRVIEILNRVVESLEHNFKIGKKKLVIPEQYLKRNEYTGDLVLEEEVDFFITTNNNSLDDTVKDVNIDLKIDEHIKAIDKLFEILSNELGFSLQTFISGESRKALTTATEVISDNSKTFKTKNHHQVLVDIFIQELIKNTLLLDSYIKKEPNNKYKDLNVIVDFDDSIAEDRNSDLDYYIKLYDNGFISKKRALKEIFNYTDEEAEIALQEIIEGEDMFVPETLDLVGVDE